MRRSKPKTLPKTRTVLDRLRNEIHSGQLGPGTHLRQAHIAAHYGVSITPVREAFAALEREGLVESNAHRGVTVFLPTVKNVGELFELRIPLESRATELAVPRLTQSDLETLDQLLEELVRSQRDGDLGRGAALNREFHGHIYAASDRKRLIELINELWVSADAYSHQFDAASPRIKQSQAEHKAIYLACAAGAARRAAQAVEDHLRNTHRALTRNLEEA